MNLQKQIIWDFPIEHDATPGVNGATSVRMHHFTKCQGPLQCLTILAQMTDD